MSKYETDLGVEPRRRYAMSSGRSTDMMGALTDAVRENPVPAALIGMGALWLFMGGGNMSLFGGRGRSSLMGTVTSGAGSVAHGAGDMARSTAHAVSNMGNSVATGISSTVGGFAESVGDAASRMGEYVKDSIGGVDSQSDYRNPSFSGGMSDAGSASMISGMRELFERHPIALGVAGLALGAGIAASLPLTSAEQDTLGKANDAMRSKLGEAAEQAKDLASAAVQEVKQQGFGGNSGHGPG